MTHNSDHKFLIENTIDQIGLKEVINLIEEICLEKADHLVVNWQDQTTAEKWERAAAILGSGKGEIKNLYLP